MEAALQRSGAGITSFQYQAAPTASMLPLAVIRASDIAISKMLETDVHANLLRSQRRDATGKDQTAIEKITS